MVKPTREKVINGIIWAVLIICAILILHGRGHAQTKDSVYQYCIDKGMPEPDFIVAQAMLETGYFTSYGSRERHNIFGFWNGERYLVFDNWQESIDYYYKWLTKKGYQTDFKTLRETLINKWGAPDMLAYIGKVEWIIRNKV